MKKMILMALVCLPAFAFANPSEWIQCSTPGDGLAAASLGVNGAGDKSDEILLTMTNEGGDSVGDFTTYVNKGVVDQMNKSGAVELTLSSEKSVQFGGSVSEAAYINLKKVDGRFEGTLAAKSIVYTLRCF